MKRILLILFVLSSIVKAQVYLDTIACYSVGPGAIYTKIKAPSMPWDIDVLKVNLKNPYIKVESIKAKDRYIGRETTGSMTSRKSTEGHFIIGAVNGDFYDTGNGQPINIQIENGELIRTPAYKLSTIGFAFDNKPMMSFVAFNSKVVAKNGTSNVINNVNEVRGTNQILLYNSYMGDSTGTNQYGTEVLVRPVKSWLVNDTVVCVVEKIESNIGNMKINTGMAVLSGNGTAAIFLANNFKVGDTVKVYQGINPGLAKLKEMIGGYPKIVFEGKNYADQGFKDEGGPDHTYNYEPRTAAGFSADSTYLYLVTVDGRGNSVGIPLPQLADVMIRLGVAYGINFDGGGSTTMNIRGTIMNHPSDGIERPDANCLAVFSTAPSSTNVLKNVALSFRGKRIYRGDKLQYSICGSDNYGNPVTVDQTLAKYSADPAIGTIDNNGAFAAVNKPAKGYVYVTYNDYKDSAYVLVKSIEKLALSPDNITIDSQKPLKLSIKAYDVDQVARAFSNNEIVWKSSDPKIATVDTLGNVYGKSEGNVKIIATFNGTVSDTVSLTVQIGKGIVLINGMENAADWKVTAQNVDEAKLSVSSSDKTQGSNSLKIDYKYTFDPSKSYSIYLDNTTPLYGIPDSLWIDAKTTDSSSTSKVNFLLSDDNNEGFRVNGFDYINSLDKFRSIPGPMSKIAPLGSGIFYAPANITRLEILLQSKNRIGGKVYSGTIWFDNFRATYPSTSTSVESKTETPQDYRLAQNYPNPFNPSTVIEFAIPENDQNVSLKVFDLLGREVASLINSRMSAGVYKVVWNAANNTSGVYFYRLQCGSYVETKKMMLVR
jgi:exopolysaccharide biosynthesis protein